MYQEFNLVQQEVDLQNQEQYIKDNEAKNQRRIPIGEFLKLKKSSFVLYCYLQQHSNWTEGEDHRYINYCGFNKTQCAKELRMGRNTLDRKLKQLEESGMVRYNTHGETQYIILPNIGDYYTLVNLDLDFIRSVLDICDENLLRVMLFHKSYSEWLKRKRGIERNPTYTVTLNYIANCIGASESHLEVITKCHNVLKGFKVINIDKATTVSKEGRTITNNYYTYLF